MQQKQRENRWGRSESQFIYGEGEKEHLIVVHLPSLFYAVCKRANIYKLKICRQLKSRHDKILMLCAHPLTRSRACSFTVEVSTQTCRSSAPEAELFS